MPNLEENWSFSPGIAKPQLRFDAPKIQTVIAPLAFPSQVYRPPAGWLQAALSQDGAPETVWVLEQRLHPRLGGLRHGTGLFPQGAF